MKTRSRDHDRTAGVGSVKRPSPGFMGETRRLRASARNEMSCVATAMSPGAVMQTAMRSVAYCEPARHVMGRSVSISSGRRAWVKQ